MDITIEVTEIIAESTINETVIYCDVVISDAGGSMVDVPIETASANGVPIPIINKNIDIIIPTKTSDLTKDDVYTKTEINNKLSAVYEFKGSVLTYAELPTDAENADVYNVEESGVNYAWVESASSWDSLGGIIGLATLTENGLLSKEDFAALAALKTHDHAGQVINPEGIKLDTVNPLVVANAGEIGWNAADGTVNLQLLNNTKLQIGQELHIYGKASEAINNRDVIQFAGVQGDHILIKKAVQSEIAVNPTLIMGIATQNIASGSFGYTTWFGKINDVFTTGFSLSDMLYFDSSGIVAGAITNVAPTAPNRKILLATIIKLQTGAAENGIIMVRPTFGTKLADLDDVDGNDTTIADTDELLKKDTAGIWKKVTWANVKTLLGLTFAKLSGGNIFSNGLNNIQWIKDFEDALGNDKVGLRIGTISGADIGSSTAGYGFLKLYRGLLNNPRVFLAAQGDMYIKKYDNGNFLEFDNINNRFGATGVVNINGTLYFGASKSADTINDRRTSNVAGVKIEERCTAVLSGGANVKGSGTWVVDSKILADGSKQFGNDTNNVTIDANGTVKLNGTATVFDDLSVSSLTLQQTGSGISQNIQEACVEFTSSSNLSDYMVQSLQLRHTWKVGSVIYPHIHLIQNSAAVPNMLIQYRWQQNGDAIETSWTNYKSNIPAFTYTSGSINQILHDGGITPPVGASLSDIVEFRIIRDNANASGLFTGADAVVGVVQVKSFDIHFESDQLGGSNLEFTK